MLCTRCKKRDATVYISQTVNGVKSEIRLCSECAKSEDGYTNIAADSLFSGIFSDGLFNAAFGTPKRVADKQCPLCKMTGRELASSGRVGCAKCYEVFNTELDSIVSGIHGGARHKGTPPEKSAADIEKARLIDKYKKEQQEAIAEQNYERAAELRDMIKALEEGEER